MSSPYIHITNVKRLNDEKVMSIDHNGEVLVIDFWATWCPPCQKPMAHNQEMINKYGAKWGDQVRIIGIAVDKDINAVRQRVQERGWGDVEHYFRGNSSCSADYGVRGIPHMLVIDKCGNIHWRGNPGGQNIEAKIEECLASNECNVPTQQASPKKPEPSPQKQESSGNSIDKDIVRISSEMRTNPKGMIPYLQEMLPRFSGTRYNQPGKITLCTNEGAAAVQEAINFLQNQQPIGGLEWNDALAQPARYHVNDQGPKGATGHNSSNGMSMSDRLAKFGQFMGHCGENCDYGSDNARDVVISLLVDDGVPSRGHRKNLFNPNFKVCGAAHGMHKGYRHMAVQNFATSFRGNGEKGPTPQAGKPQPAQPQRQRQQQPQVQVQRMQMGNFGPGFDDDDFGDFGNMGNFGSFGGHDDIMKHHQEMMKQMQQMGMQPMGMSPQRNQGGGGGGGDVQAQLQAFQNEEPNIQEPPGACGSSTNTSISFDGRKATKTTKKTFFLANGGS